MEHIIEISHLCKSFGDVKAVDDLSFHVRKGELFAFLGMNGAGKSTTIGMMTGQLQKDTGSIIIDGTDTDKEIRGIKEKIGVVFQNSLLDKSLTVRDNLRSRAALYGITGEKFAKRLADLSQMLGFEDLLSRTLGKLSGGQKRRVDIARALLHEPEILILDEPSTGLDPQTRRLFRDVMEKLRKEKGMTVFLTTHYMEEAEDADYVVILDGGKIAAEGTPLELKNRYSGDYITLYGVKEESVKELSRPYVKVGNAFKIEVSDTAAATALIIENREMFRDYEVTKGRMDDIFLSVTGKKLMGDEEK